MISCIRLDTTERKMTSPTNCQPTNRATTGAPAQQVDTVVTRIRGGAPSSDVWDHVSRVMEPSGKILQTCNYCGTMRKSVQSLASQWAIHLVERCPSVDTEISMEIYEAKRDSIKGIKEGGERRGFHLGDLSRVTPAIPNTRNKPADEGQTSTEGGNERNAKRKLEDKEKSISVWDHITKTALQDGIIVQKCNHCGYTRKANQLLASSWCVHLVEQCAEVDPSISYEMWQAKRDSVRAVRDAGSRRGFTDDTEPSLLVKAEPSQKISAKVIKEEKKAEKGNSGATAVSHSIPQKKQRMSLSASKTNSQKKQRVMVKNGEDFCDQARADKITLAIMEFLAGCGIPMMVTQSAFFINFLMQMNKTYTKKYLPTADIFTKMWLPKLRASVDQKLDHSWRADTDLYMTLGSDIFKGEDGTNVLVVTEAKLDKVAFRQWVTESDETLTSSRITEIVIDRMTTAANGEPNNIEAKFGGFCADTSKVGLSVCKAIEEKYPKVLFNGCRSRCGQALCKDFADIPQIKKLVENVGKIFDFLCTNKPVQAVYSRLMKELNGSRLTSPPDYRATNVDEELEYLLGPEERNIEVLKSLISHAEWDSISVAAPPGAVADFVAIAQDAEFFHQVKCIRGITQPLSIFTRHLDRSGFRASWLLPAFEAFEKDLLIWCDDASTANCFNEETISTVKKAFGKRWKGSEDGEQEDSNAVGLYAPQYLLSMLLDPSTTMNVEKLNQVHPLWYPECRKVLMRFYDDNDLILAKTQLYELVNQNGLFGDEVAESRAYIEVDAAHHHFNIQTVVARQVKAFDLKPHLLWKISIGGQFPKLKDVALRLLTMATRCSDVQNVCEMENFVNKRICKRLKNDVVRNLLYCHINLKLVKNSGTENDQGNVVEDFLCESILDAEDETDVKSEEDCEEENRTSGAFEQEQII